MKKYQIFIKLRNRETLNSKVREKCVPYNDEITKILDLLIQHVDSFVSVLKQACDQKDQVLINALIDALIEGTILRDKKEIQKIISSNDYEIVRLITTYGYVDILNKLLETIPAKKRSKTFILKLVTIAAVNRQATTVGHLVKTLFPK
jgi:uncharacterized protein YaaQ